MNKTLLIALTVLLVASSQMAHAQFIGGFNYNRAVSGTSTGTATTPGGADTNVQYNSGGAFAGNSGMTYDGVTLSLISNTSLAINPSDTAGVTRIMFNGGRGAVYYNGSMGLQAGSGRNVIFLPNGDVANATMTVASNRFVAIGSGLNIPSSTLHVSGTSILGICNATITCGAPQNGAACYSTVRATLALCNGAGSWIPLVSTTIVSASGL